MPPAAAKTAPKTTPRKTARTAPAKAAAAPIAEEAEAPAREPRGARRKRDTRARLLGAALRLMADKGVDGVAINEITEAADVGFGSFYNHFPSKEAVYEALITEVVGQFAGALDHLSEQIQDPAEKIAGCIRYVIKRGQQDPLWGRFVVRSGFTADGVSAGMGRYFLQDLADGIARKRFRIDDPAATFVAVGSIVLGALATEVELKAGRSLPFPMLQDTKNIGERITVLVLQLLGLPAADAHEVARRPLPDIALPANPFGPDN
ncbi:MAG: TetR/AcrR family transcriptional regulator [Pseudomonadota bacterium]